ncbi:uncharacterized protein LOC143031041 [Oratosquilla oratoria]|uniref:uncharacterized protein LOC143031041 n=1 Tax=Oratosquilla oratoria TaxID=337810 RepID=UPI003F768074
MDREKKKKVSNARLFSPGLRQSGILFTTFDKLKRVGASHLSLTGWGGARAPATYPPLLQPQPSTIRDFAASSNIPTFQLESDDSETEYCEGSVDERPSPGGRPSGPRY